MLQNRLAYFLAGAALGAAGAAIAKGGKGQDILQSLVKGGYGSVEKLLGSVETIREDIEDYLAEAKFQHEEKVKTATAATKAATEEAPKKAAKKTSAKKPAAKKTTRKAATKKTAASTKTAAKKTPARKTAAKPKAVTKKTESS